MAHALPRLPHSGFAHMVQVERLLPADAAAVSALMRDVIAFLQYYNDLAKASEIEKYSAAALVSACTEDPDSVLLARAYGRISGFCVSHYDDGLLWLAWIGVHPEARRSGLATELLTALESTARQRKCHKIWCDCRTNNEASKALLSRNGYSQIALLPNHWYGQDFILWHKLV